MENVLNTILEFIRIYIAAPFETMHLTDVFDIAVLTVLLYLVYSFVRVRRAGRVAFGIFMIFGLYGLFGLAGLRATRELMRVVFSSGIIVLAVIFQSELRAGLEKLGNSVRDLRGIGQAHAAAAAMVNEVVEAACTVAQQEHDGALIVIQKSTPLGDYADNGTRLDAVVSAGLLAGIFVNKAPLHDGAVIIQNDRVVAAACKLPIKSSGDAAKGLGTRHRAAIGITEMSDSVVVVVSEEKHIISIANNGQIKRDYNPGGMKDLQTEEGLKSVQKRLREDLYLLVLGESRDSVQSKLNKKRTKEETSAPAAVRPVYRLARLVRIDRNTNKNTETDVQSPSVLPDAALGADGQDGDTVSADGGTLNP